MAQTGPQEAEESEREPPRAWTGPPARPLDVAHAGESSGSSRGSDGDPPGSRETPPEAGFAGILAGGHAWRGAAFHGSAQPRGRLGGASSRAGERGRA